MKPKGVCFVGPMLYQSGFVKTQGEILADLLERAGYRVFRKSEFPNRILRFLDTSWFLLFRPSKYDVVIVQVYGGLSFYMEDMASAIARFHRKKIIMTLHGGALPDFFKSRQSWAKRVLRRSNLLTCPSDFLVGKLKYLGLPFCEVPNVIRLADYPFLDKKEFNPLTILWMRAYHDLYNPLLCLDAFERVADRYPGARLVMAGPDMGMFDQVQQRVSGSLQRDNITLLRRIDLKQKIELANQCQVYLNTNRIDNAPVSMVEMAAFGLALVSTNVGGIPFLFRNEQLALLVDQTPEALAEAVIRVVEFPQEASERIARARAEVQRFDEYVVVQKWQELIESVCAV
ncbi:MAG: glycosyltransferase family 4 protein [Cyclobacteriaceae bacterium]|jgi:glycosyltransferase involved in cell wall biosynthesis